MRPRPAGTRWRTRTRSDSQRVTPSGCERAEHMRVTITGASGLIGRRLVRALAQRGDEVTALSRNPASALEGATVVAWDPLADPAPAEALQGRDGVVNLAGEPVAQRWNAERKR